MNEVTTNYGSKIENLIYKNTLKDSWENLCFN